MSNPWKVAILKDSSRPMLGLHGLHTAFRGLPDVEVVAHVDANTDHLKGKLAQTRARRHYATCAAMLEHESPDIVVLCSRHPGDHLEPIRQAAEKGCHIYCEKPVSAFLPEVDEMVRIAEENHIKIGVAHPARHDLGFLTLRRMMEAGMIGTPRTVLGRGKCDHRSGGEDLIVLGMHILDLQTFFFGPPESVMADILTNGRPATHLDQMETVEPIGPVIGDEIWASFQFAGNVRGLFESRRELLKPNERPMGICVMGTEGVLSLSFDDAGTPPLLISHQPGFPEKITGLEEIPLQEDRLIPDAEPLDYSLCGQQDIPRAPWFAEANRFAAWDLMQAIEEDRQPVSNIYNARLALEMIYGIYTAHLTRRTVPFPLTSREHPLAAGARLQ